MGVQYVVQPGVPAVRYHAGLASVEDFITTKRNAFSSEELILRSEDDLEGYPRNSIGADLVRRGLVVFKRQVFGRVWLLAVAPEHVEGI